MSNLTFEQANQGRWIFISDGADAHDTHLGFGVFSMRSLLLKSLLGEGRIKNHPPGWMLNLDTGRTERITAAGEDYLRRYLSHTEAAERERARDLGVQC